MKETEIVIYNQNIWGCTRGDDIIANRCRLISELADYHDADIISFQECSKEARDIADGNICELLAPSYEEVKHDAVGNNFTPIFYKSERFDVIESGYILYERQRPTNSKSITFALFNEKESNIKFAVLSAHFWWRAGTLEDEEVRFYNAQLLSKKACELKKKYDVPVFLMGDFNCGNGSAAGMIPYLYLKEKFLDIREIAPISTEEHTHHESPKINEIGEYTANERRDAESTLDHIFVTEHRNVAIDSFEVDTSDEAYASSDHFPLIARARIFGD